MYNLYQGDCLEVMKEIPDKSIDLICSDPPYGTTACKWDTVIDLDLMWAQLKRIIKPNGAIVLTASQPFTTRLISSNYKMFKYCLVWQKTVATNPMMAKKQPLKKHEDVAIFYRFQPGFNPQMVPGKPYKQKERISSLSALRGAGGVAKAIDNKGTRYPSSIQMFKRDNPVIHPTQKPVALMEYMIRTYTNKFETVLDFTMGSGTTGVAARNLARYFIGIELDAGYCEIARDRIENG